MGLSGPTPEKIQEWTALLAAAKNRREDTQQHAKEADVAFRKAIQGAAKAGLSAPQISVIVGLSTYRIYQIVNGRRT